MGIDPFGRFHCSDNSSLNDDRVCKSLACEGGWKGESCDMRDCEVNDGNCGMHDCMTFTTLNTNISECTCNAGFHKFFTQGECVDDQECIIGNHTCDLSTSDCVNTLGSYECHCRNGFVKSVDDEDICIDINECIGEHKCNQTRQNCFNTIGSYRCDCETGFQLFTNDECIDIDECCDDANSCDGNISQCLNTFGSHVCLCLDGYQPDPSGLKACKTREQYFAPSYPHLRNSLIIFVLISMLLTISTVVLSIVVIKILKRLQEVKNIMKVLYSNSNDSQGLPTHEENHYSNPVYCFVKDV